jgi:hypothetical protein
MCPASGASKGAVCCSRRLQQREVRLYALADRAFRRAYKSIASTVDRVRSECPYLPNLRRDDLVGRESVERETAVRRAGEVSAVRPADPYASRLTWVTSYFMGI